MKKYRKLSSLLVGALMLASAACDQQKADVPPVDTPSREVRDDLGRTVVVPDRIERAISLAPSLTEMIFAVGAGDRLVGVTTYCNYPPESAAIEKIGDTQTPNIERIIALRPQVVFVSTASQLETFSKTLEQQGIAVYVTNPTTLDEVFTNMKDLGDLLGTTGETLGAVAALAGRAGCVRHQATYDGGGRAREKQRVFIQISNEPLFTIGRESFLTELIEHAGGVSVTRDVPTAYPKLSKETAAALDPEVIFLSGSEDNREPSAALKNSKAVRDGRVYRINADIISRPGPRLIDALEEIAGRLMETK